MSNMSLSMRIGAVVDGSLNRVLGGVNRDFERLGSTTTQLQARQERLSRIIERGMQRGNMDLTRFRREQERVTRAIEETRRAQERLNRSVERERRIGEAQSKAGGNLATSTAQLAAFAVPVGASVKQSAEFKDQVVDLSITAGWNQQEEMRIGEMTRQNALKYNQATTQINEGIGVLVAGGISSAKELELYTPKITKAVTATRASWQDIGAMTLAMNDNLNIGAKGWDRATNILVSAGKSGQFEVRDMAKWLPSLTPYYQAMGIQGEQAVAEIGASLQIARKGAGSSDEAANNMRNFMAKLTAPDTLKDFDKAGIDLKTNMKTLVAQGFTPMGAMMHSIEQYIGTKSPKAVGEFTKAMSIKDDKERQMAVDRLAETYKLGELFQDQQALGFIRPMLNNKDEYQKIRQDSLVNADKDMIGADFNKRMTSPIENLKKIKINISEVAITLGDALLPALGEAITAITPLIQSFAAWAKENPELIAGTVKIVGGMLLAKAAFWGVSFAVLSVIRPIASLVTTFNRLRAGITVLRNMAILGQLSPILMKLGAAFKFVGGMLRAVGLAAMANPLFIAIGSLAVAGYLIYRNWTPIKAFFINLWNGIKSAAIRGVAAIRGALGRFNPMPIFSRAWRSVTSFFTSTWNRLKAFSQSGIRNILATIASFSPIGLFIRAFSAVFSYFNGLAARFRQYGVNMIQGLIGGITAKFGELKAKMSEMASSVAGWFSGKLDINSPSRVFARIAHSIPEGIALGVNDKSSVALGAIGSLSTLIGSSHIASPQFSLKQSAANDSTNDNQIRFDKAAQSSQTLARQGTTGATGGNVIHFSPTIHVGAGNSADTQAAVNSAMTLAYDEFASMMRRYEHDNRRRAF